MWSSWSLNIKPRLCLLEGSLEYWSTPRHQRKGLGLWGAKGGLLDCAKDEIPEILPLYRLRRLTLSWVTVCSVCLFKAVRTGTNIHTSCFHSYSEIVSELSVASWLSKLASGCKYHCLCCVWCGGHRYLGAESCHLKGRGRPLAKRSEVPTLPASSFHRFPDAAILSSLLR